MYSTILFRGDLDTEGELDVCKSLMPTVEYRSQIVSDSLVIGRYSVLPFYEELDRELKLSDSMLINSWKQHSYIASMMSWVEHLGDLTPKTWKTWQNLPEGAYVLKGATNSRKQSWLTHMFCPNLASIPSVSRRLYDDSLLIDQGIVIREYVPLVKLDEGLNGLPITNEWRCFFLGKRLLAKGYYWGTHPEAMEKAAWTDEAMSVAQKAADIVSNHVNFFVIDVAETQSGRWIVVEINDGQMSGLSTIPPIDLYTELHKSTVLESFSPIR